LKLSGAPASRRDGRIAGSNSTKLEPAVFFDDLPRQMIAKPAKTRNPAR
jgi:hypothetical protein